MYLYLYILYIFIVKYLVENVCIKFDKEGLYIIYHMVLYFLMQSAYFWPKT